MEKGRLDSVSQCASEIIEISEPAGEPSDTEKNNEDKASTTADSSVFNKETIEKKQLYLIIFGLVMLYFVAALDTTILATVYIDISSQYDDLTNGIWIITSYLLSTTAVQPLYGKFSDITGRLEACIASVLVFCLGSVLCAVSHSMTMLIACRAVQGIGGGGLMAMVSVILSDTTTERDRGKYTGFLAGSWGIASAIGPVLGGAIVENASWRIIFWINLPVCIPTIAVLYFVLKIPRPQGSVREKLRRIDFAGALVFQCCIIPILIAFAWGGQGYKWVSGRVLGTIGGGVVMGVLFIVIEWRVSPEPIVPLRLFRFRNVTASTLAHFFLGACTYAPMMFIPSWELAVKHSTEIKAGLHLIPMMCSMVISAALSGILMTRTGRYRPFIWIGGAIIATGNTLLILLDVDSNNGQRIGFIFLTGIGLGFTIQTMIIAAQCAVKGGDMAVITTLVLFARTLGGIFSLSILSSVFNNGLRTESAVLAAQYPQYATTIHNSISDQSIVSKARDIPDDLLMGLTTMFQKTLHKVFIGLIPFSGLFVLSTLLFAHVDLNVKRKKTIK
ncbi:MFS general substrate transporter [Martensiomyces pterosporus]|nr:MFS general substrate transporter [Martensiomyces pterosporus]